MVLLRPGWQADYEGRPAVYPIGCAGVITHAERLADGRFNIVLRGMGGASTWTYSTIILQKSVPDRLQGRLFALDLANVAARRDLFNRLSQEASRVLVITEGLVVYLSDQEAVSLAEDLAGTPTFHRWALDMVSPALMQRMQKSDGLRNLARAGAPLKFAPEEGPAFFERHGWTLVDVQSMLHTAATLKRLSFGMRLIALLPDSKGRTPRSPWGGVCLFERQRRLYGS
jgi:hypothetical protein